MRLKPGKTYIKKERKTGFIIMAVAVIVAMLIVVIIELLPSDIPELGYTQQNGLGRSFMYPFVYTDSQNDLYVLNSDNSVNMVDNNTQAAVHDSTHNTIYYLKDATLFEYDIKNNDRISLCSDILDFTLMGNRRCVVCKDTANRTLIYMFQGKELKLLTRDGYEGTSYVVGNEGVAYIDGDKLKYCDYTGKIKTISNKLNNSKPIYISEENDICFYEENKMVISNTAADVKDSINAGEVVVNQEEAVLIKPTTFESTGLDTIPFKYFLGDISHVAEKGDSNDSQRSEGKLYYFDGEFSKLSENVYEIIYYSNAEDFLLFSVLKGEKVDIYLSVEGEKPEKQISCNKSSSFVFDNRSNYLYVCEVGKLFRYDIFDVNYKRTDIANDVENVYDYKNKPFVAYTDSAQEYLYLIEKENIEKLELGKHIRLYGKNHEIYLLCNLQENGLVTIDYVSNDRMTRIADDASVSVFFDKELEYVIYNKSSKLYLWHEGKTISIGKYDGIKAVDII